ncbi:MULTISPECIES: hypothetical protein [unclassified Anabaena]|uniref:hypothetical protein n=1 Tax=unclassified Anabaena TaxID=2619674 RepID=UPI0039C668E8
MAFANFWSQAYLQQAGWQQEIDFWNSEIRYLIQANYYRDINKSGKFIAYFWLIDLPHDWKSRVCGLKTSKQVLAIANYMRCV